MTHALTLLYVTWYIVALADFTYLMITENLYALSHNHGAESARFNIIQFRCKKLSNYLKAKVIYLG